MKTFLNIKKALPPKKGLLKDKINPLELNLDPFPQSLRKVPAVLTQLYLLTADVAKNTWIFCYLVTTFHSREGKNGL